MKKFLGIEDNKLNRKYFLLLMLISFLFSILIRYIWIYEMGDIDRFYWNGQLMINTNDGYLWAEGARDILAGFHQDNDLSPININLSQLTAFLYKILAISFETLILWLPAVMGSLLIIPIMLIARVFNYDILGFFASLLGGIAWSYYNRTMIGYYDTDLLVVVLPAFMVWGLIFSIYTKRDELLIIGPIFAILSIYWHSGTINIISGTFFITILYTIILDRKNFYLYKLLSIFIISMMSIPVLIKIILVLNLGIAYYFYKTKLTEKNIYIIFSVLILLYLIFGGMSWILGFFSNAYLTREAIHTADDILNQSLHYYGVVNTVREAGHISFNTFANRISGGSLILLFSIIGYILFVIRHKLFILSLPMVGVGFFALIGGLRFTVFAVPFMALGLFYIIFLLVDYLITKNQYIKYFIISISTIIVLYPNITHIISYKVPTVMSTQEVKVLDKLKNIASREDYVISWWDYGYPIRYYADVKTIIDGGKHVGGDNFTVSYALLNSQLSAANMMRLDVEFTEINFEEKCGSTSFECMLKRANIKEPSQFLNALNSTNITLPKKSRDIFIYLPNRMMNIIPTIDLFSNLDLKTGKAYKQPIFYKSTIKSVNGAFITLDNGIKFNQNNGKVYFGKQVVSANRIVITDYNKKGILIKKVKGFDRNSQIYLIFMKSYNQFLVLDKRMFNSLYIQLFVLEDYNKKLFEPIILTPLAKVYKLKK